MDLLLWVVCIVIGLTTGGFIALIVDILTNGALFDRLTGKDQQESDIAWMARAYVDMTRLGMNGQEKAEALRSMHEVWHGKKR